MKNTVVLVSSNRQVFEKTSICINKLRQAGAHYLLQAGSACVAAARNLALSGACDYMRKNLTVDTVLMVDDDMLFTLEHASEVVEDSRTNVCATSAMYATLVTTLAAERLPRLADGEQRWLTGLGFIAIPRALLFALESNSEKFSFYKNQVTEFTWACAEAGRWVSEDFRLCQRLGGVRLLPLAVGHLKTIPIYPDPRDVESIAMGVKLADEMNLSQLDNISRDRLQEPTDQQKSAE